MSGSPAHQRAQAARLLHSVIEQGRTTDQAMAGNSATPLTRELLHGSLRHYFSLSRRIDQLLDRPLKERDHIVRYLMIVGAYQLLFTRVPAHAALNETVNACRELGRPWARGLVNAVLRQCHRAAGQAERSFEHPSWLEAALRDAYRDAEAVMTANNGRAPMALRINTRRIAADDYLERLDAVALRWRSPHAEDQPGAVALGPETRVLEAPCRTRDLPGFDQGLVSVQDAGAQFAALLLAPGPGARVLDACAAPGGKLFHLAERCPEAALTAVETSAERLAQMRIQAERLGHDHVTYLQGDATDLAWWDGVPFQQVLVDAPCSGTGTLRRHPDIKVLRRAQDVPAMAELQRRLLSNLWRVLEPGGTLVYCTCSILPAENDEVVGDFLTRREDARLSAFQLATGRPTQHGWQLLPTNADTDGFYYARMIKATQ